MNEYDIHGIQIASDIALQIPDYFEVKVAEEPSFLAAEKMFVRLPQTQSKRSGVFDYYVNGNSLYVDYKIPMFDVTFRMEKYEGGWLLNFTREIAKRGEIDKLSQIIFRLMLIERGWPLIHAGAIARDGKATLITAPPDHGKTSTVLSLLNQETKFVGDDHVFIDWNGMIRSYPKPVNLSPFTLTGNLVNRSNSIPQQLKRSMAKSTFEMLFGKLGIEMGEKRRISDWLIEDEAELERVFILTYGDSGISKINQTEAARKIVNGTMDEFSPFSHYAILLYAHIFDVDLLDYVNEMRDIIGSAVDGVPCYEVAANQVKEYPELIEEKL